MSSRNDGVKLKKFCQAIPPQIKDEDTAVAEYTDKAEEARKLNYPGAEIIAALYESLATQEASHAEALRKVQKEVCPI